LALTEAEHRGRLRAKEGDAVAHDRHLAQQNYIDTARITTIKRQQEVQQKVEIRRITDLEAQRAVHAKSQAHKCQQERNVKTNAADLEAIRKKNETDRMRTGLLYQRKKTEEEERAQQARKEADEARTQAHMEAQGLRFQLQKKQVDAMDDEKESRLQRERQMLLDAQGRQIDLENKRSIAAKERLHSQVDRQHDAQLVHMSQEEHLRQYMIAKKKAVFADIPDTGFGQGY